MLEDEDDEEYLLTLVDVDIVNLFISLQLVSSNRYGDKDEPIELLLDDVIK